MKKNNAIVYMTNRKYDFLLGVCLVNLKKTNQKYDSVIVYHDCFTDEEIKKFQLIEPKTEFRFYSLEDFYKENQLIENPQTQKYLERFSHFTPVRIRKSLELLREYKSVLYLDLDTLIIDDISEIFSVPGATTRLSPVKNCFTTYVQESIESFEEKYPNFLNTIDKELEFYIGHPNAGVIYFEESLPYEDMILESKKWLRSHWTDKNHNIFTYDEMLLPYLFLKFKIRPHNMSGINIQLRGEACFEKVLILHNFSPDDSKKIWNNRNSLLLFPQWQDYYMESVKIVGIEIEGESQFLTDAQLSRSQIIYESQKKDFWINILSSFRIPAQLRISNDFTHTYLHLFTMYNNIYYELKYNRDIFLSKVPIYIQLFVKDDNVLMYSIMNKLQKKVPQIIASVTKDKANSLIVTTKPVVKEQIQRLFDDFFSLTFPLISHYIKNEVIVAKLKQENENLKIQINDISDKLRILQNDVQNSLGYSKETVYAEIFNNAISHSEWLKNTAFSAGRWAVGYPYLYAMYRVLNEIRPKNILELGLGQSTRMIGQYAGYHNDISHFVVEHDEEWINFFQRDFTLSEHSKIIKLNYTMKAYKEASAVRVYEGFLEQFKNQKFDFISIDAPFGGDMKEYARIDVLELLPNCLSEDFVIMIDDTERVGETNTIKELMEILNKNAIEFNIGRYSGKKDCSIITSARLKWLCSM